MAKIESVKDEVLFVVVVVVFVFVVIIVVIIVVIVVNVVFESFFLIPENYLVWSKLSQ